MAAVTAPHRVCPMTRISFAPATAHPYSTLPSTFRLEMFPAMRTLRMVPHPPCRRSTRRAWRESMQLSTTARGCCPLAVELTLATEVTGQVLAVAEPLVAVLQDLQHLLRG